MQAVKLNINKHQWSFLASELRWCAENAPVEGWEVESCLLAELYKSRIGYFTFFKSNRQGKSAFTIQASQAYAINVFLGEYSIHYNAYLRANLEPKLPPARS